MARHAPAAAVKKMLYRAPEVPPMEREDRPTAVPAMAASFQGMAPSSAASRAASAPLLNVVPQSPSPALPVRGSQRFV